MKKGNILLTYATAFTVLLSSCKDEVEEMEVGKTEMPTKFSSYTPEQNKTNLEDNGIEFLNDMSNLKSSNGVQSSAAFVSFLDMAPAAPANGRIMHTARALKNYHEGKGSAHDIFTTMRKTEEEPESIQAMFDMYVGVYDWNSELEDWDYSKEGNKIIFNFPSVAGGSSNNASFIIHSYTGVNTPNHFDDDYTGDLPTQLIMELQVAGNKEMEYKFNASYNSQGEPTSVITSLTVGTYVFSVVAENTTDNIGVEYSLKKSSKILMSMGAGAKGTFTAEHIESIDNSESGNVGDIAKEANAYFQLMNIKIAGNINMEKFADGQDEIDAGSDSENFDHDKATEDKAALLNENFILVVFYADSKEKIADTEVYTYTDYYTTYEPVYDENGYLVDYKEEEVPYTAMDIRMIFADDSKSDLETYFGEGFDDLAVEFNKFAYEQE